jgi:hypothetical protein
MFFTCGSQWLSLVGFNPNRLVSVGVLSFRKVAFVLVILWLWSYDSTSPCGVIADFVSELQSGFLSSFSARSGEQAVYVPFHTYVILFVYVACVAAFLAFSQTGQFYGKFLLALSAASGLSHFIALAGLSIFFGGLWSLYNDFSLLL